MACYCVIFFFDMTIKVYQKSVYKYVIFQTILMILSYLKRNKNWILPNVCKSTLCQEWGKQIDDQELLCTYFREYKLATKNGLYESPNLSEYEYNLFLKYIFMLKAISMTLER